MEVIKIKERIKQIREYFNITQKELAERIGVKTGTITAYEAGYRKPTDSVVLSICKEFHVNEEWLKNNIGEMVKPYSREVEIAKIVGELYKLDDESFKFKLISALSVMDEDHLNSFKLFISGLMNGR